MSKVFNKKVYVCDVVSGVKNTDCGYPMVVRSDMNLVEMFRLFSIGFGFYCEVKNNIMTNQYGKQFCVVDELE